MSAAVRLRPILFSGAMIRALFAGTKTQTRRVISPQPEPFFQATPDRHPQRHAEPYLDSYCGEKKTRENPRGMSEFWHWWTRDDRTGPMVARCPYGVPGGRLWVRETWALRDDVDWKSQPDKAAHYVIHREGYSDLLEYEYHTTSRWRSGRFMPLVLSRITIEITDVRVQRLQEISEEDARAEGVTPFHISADQQMVGDERGRTQGTHPHVLAYAVLWDTINADRALWSTNPFVWALTFRVVTPEPSR